MSSSNRQKVLEEALTVYFILLDGNSHTVKGFSHLEIHPKTLRRILQTLEKIPIVEVTSSKEKIGTSVKWRCSKNIKDHKKTTHKECYKCLNRLELNENNFFRNRRIIDGFGDVCKKCFIARHKIYFEKNKERINKVRRSRYKRQNKLFLGIN